MKRILFATCACMWLAAHAQQNTPTAVLPQLATVTDIGMSGNMYTCAYGTKAYLWADPFLKILVFSHRGGPVVGDSTTRYIRYDYSPDGGYSWQNNLGPIFSDTTHNELICYPQVAIRNPPGNIFLDSAYIAYYGPFASNKPNNNVWWNGQSYGVSKLTGPLNPTQHSDTCDATFYGQMVEEMFITQQNVIWLPDPARDSISDHYRDTIILTKGTWDPVTLDYNYTRTLLPVPVTSSGPYLTGEAYVDCRIAFAPNGQDGFLVVLGHHTAYNQGTFVYPIVYKTTDGGNTWSNPVHVPLNGIGPQLGSPAFSFSCGSQIDLVVDGLGNPHIITTAGVGTLTYSFFTYNPWGVFDITSPDGGLTWTPYLVARPHRLNGSFGTGVATITDDVRPQISMNYAGDKIFYNWFSTDTTLHPAVSNIYPDAFIRGYDVATGLWSPVYNISDSVVGAQGQVLLGNTSYYAVRGLNGGYYVPITFAEPTDSADMLAPAQHKYLGGYSIPDSAFAVSISEFHSSPAAVVCVLNSLAPNPSADKVVCEITVNQPAVLVYELRDRTGKLVCSWSEDVSPGVHRVPFDVSQYTPGLYLFSVSAGYQHSTAKLLVE